MLRWNGTNWAKVSNSTSKVLHGIWGSGPSDVWIVGEEGTILRWQGSGWSAVASGTDNNFLGVGGSGPSDVWASGGEGMILRYAP